MTNLHGSFVNAVQDGQPTTAAPAAAAPPGMQMHNSMQLPMQSAVTMPGSLPVTTTHPTHNPSHVDMSVVSPSTAAAAAAAAAAADHAELTQVLSPSGELQELPEMSSSLTMPAPPEESYPDKASLLRAVQAHSKTHGYKVVVKSSSTPTDKKPGRTAKIWLRCDRGGQYRPRNGLTEETRKRKRYSRLLDCPFMLVAAGRPGIWSLSVLNGTHNHGPIIEKPRTVSQKPKKGQVKASPVDWPHDATFTPFTTALVVMDMQRDCQYTIFLSIRRY